MAQPNSKYTAHVLGVDVDTSALKAAVGTGIFGLGAANAHSAFGWVAMGVGLGLAGKGAHEIYEEETQKRRHSRG